MSANVSLASLLRSIRPGEMSTCDLKVTNTGSEPDRFSIRVVDDLSEWAWASPTSLMLDPGAEGTARIACKPPRLATTKAGVHTLRVVVAGGRDPGHPSEVTSQVEIDAFRDVVADLEPPEGTGRLSSAYRLIVHNRGNVELRCALRAGEDDGAVSLRFEPDRLEVAPGHEGTAEVVASVSKPNRTREAVSNRFKVLVQPDDAAPIGLDGVMRQDPRRGRRWLLAGAAVSAAVVLVIAALSIASPSKDRPGVAASRPGSCPGAGHLAATAAASGNIPRTRRTNVIEPDNYSFLFLADNCFPMRFNPCEPIHFVLDASAATPANLADLKSAMSMVTQATGITFVSDGEASDAAGEATIAAAAAAQGRWPPVTIGWKHLGGGNNLTETAGGGLPEIVDGVIVSGVVFFNADARLSTGAVPDGFGAGVTWGRIELHELGHLVGLGHVSSVDEDMHEPITDPSSRMSSTYGVGDLAGLRLVGRSAGCEKIPALRNIPQRTSPANTPQRGPATTVGTQANTAPTVAQ